MPKLTGRTEIPYHGPPQSEHLYDSVPVHIAEAATHKHKASRCDGESRCYPGHLAIIARYTEVIRDQPSCVQCLAEIGIRFG